MSLQQATTTTTIIIIQTYFFKTLWGLGFINRKAASTISEYDSALPKRRYVKGHYKALQYLMTWTTSCFGWWLAVISTLCEQWTNLKTARVRGGSENNTPPTIAFCQNQQQKKQPLHVATTASPSAAVLTRKKSNVIKRKKNTKPPIWFDGLCQLWNLPIRTENQGFVASARKLVHFNSGSWANIQH